MSLPIRTSKKGTRVIRATDLHRALELSDHHYQRNARQWLQDLYEFDGVVRIPASHRDYARIPHKAGELVDDYYLGVELAKFICLRSKSKRRQALANILRREQLTVQDGPTELLFNAAEIVALTELTRAMSLLSCQEAAEIAHQEIYKNSRGTLDYYNRYRAELLGYTQRRPAPPPARPGAPRIDFP